MEADYKVEQWNPGLNIDLSEQNMVTCIGDCNGVWPYDYLRDDGVVDENCFPYQSADCGKANPSTNQSVCTCSKKNPDGTPFIANPCDCDSSKCSDWKNRIWKISGYHRVLINDPGMTDMQSVVKKQLICGGPVVTSVDIKAYDEYGPACSKLSDQVVSAHAVVLVGYSDSGGYWIIKNSYGVDWGDQGYFKIDYNPSSPKCRGPDYIILALLKSFN